MKDVQSEMAKTLRHMVTLSSLTLNSLHIRSKSSLLLSHFRNFCSSNREYYRFREMSAVFVKNFEQDERLQISVDLTMPNGATKSLNLHRLKSEELRLAVERLRINLTKKFSKKSKQKKKKGADTDGASNEDEQDEPQIPIEIFHNGSPLDLSVSNESAWIDGAVLRVGEEQISVCYNPPSVKLEKLPSTIMEGFPLFPEVELEFAELKSCDFYWKTVDEKQVQKIKSDIGRGALDLSNAINSPSYTPQPADIGRFILLVCVPKNGEKVGRMDTVLSSVPVTPGPGPCPFEKRHEFTKERAPQGSFRVLSYNLLAQIYADTDVARQQLFGYCPGYALDMDYRKHLLLKEILGYQADLLCLQEVDKSIFTSQLTPALTTLGYTGFFRPKEGQVSEGCANFIRGDKFRIDNELDITLSAFLSMDPLCADIWSKVCKIPPLKEKLEERSSILQVTVLESVEKPGNYVCLANTHLYFHPTACNVRLIHAAAAMRHLQYVCDTYTQEGKNISLVFCGDFNSAPHLGVYQLMTAQFVPSDHADWSSAGDEQLLSSLELTQPMNIVSAYGIPPYTNFTSGFQATLDYIFLNSDKLEVIKVVPLPDHEEVIANVALPSIVFPSDHLALISDLKFR